MAYYCTHCATSLEIMTIEQLGYPAWVIKHEPDGMCVQRIYKDPEGVPEEYYKRVGMEKRLAIEPKVSEVLERGRLE